MSQLLIVSFFSSPSFSFYSREYLLLKPSMKNISFLRISRVTNTVQSLLFLMEIFRSIESSSLLGPLLNLHLYAIKPFLSFFFFFFAPLTFNKNRIHKELMVHRMQPSSL